MSDGRVSSAESNKSVTPQMGQNYEDDDVIIKVEPVGKQMLLVSVLNKAQPLILNKAQM